MINIEDFGFKEGISEIILTTLSHDNIPNAAPMGIHREGKRLFIRVFNSTTLMNIIANPKAAANIIDDPVLFVRSALSDIEPATFKFQDGFPFLEGALGWIVFECKYKKGEKISHVELSPIQGHIIRKVIKPVNRGFNAVIEAAINATRYVEMKEADYLSQIDHSNTIVRKCGGTREKEAMRILYELINPRS